MESEDETKSSTAAAEDAEKKGADIEKPKDMQNNVGITIDKSSEEHGNGMAELEAKPKQQQPRDGKRKHREKHGVDPLLAKVQELREQRDRMKQEAKKLSSEVRTENRRRVRLKALAEKLSNADLWNLVQQRGMNANDSGAASST